MSHWVNIIYFHGIEKTWAVLAISKSAINEMSNIGSHTHIYYIPLCSSEINMCQLFTSENIEKPVTSSKLSLPCFANAMNTHINWNT